MRESITSSKSHYIAGLLENAIHRQLSITDLSDAILEGYGDLLLKGLIRLSSAICLTLKEREVRF